MDLGHDDFERELRDVLTDGRHALREDLVPLTAVHAGAVRRRRRRRSMVGVAGALALATIGIPLGAALAPDAPAPQFSGGAETLGRPASGTPSSRPSDSSPSTAPAAPRPVAGWGDAQPISVTATSSETFVVLGTSRSCQQDCLRIAQSHDGGGTFTSLPVPAVAPPGPDGRSRSSVSDVRFGSAQDGWLFGEALWATHDGGQSWQHVDIAGSVARLEAAAGRAWALVGRVGDDTQQLWSAPTSGDRWTRVPGVSVTGPADLAVEGSRVVVLGTMRSAAWVVDATGATRVANPCADALQTRLSTSQWATCVTGTAAYVASSTDGRTWRRVRVDTAAGALPNSVAIGARTPQDALLGVGQQPLRHLDATGHTTAVRRPPSGEASYLGFTSVDVGYAVAGAELWRTDDGGDTWTRLAPG